MITPRSLAAARPAPASPARPAPRPGWPRHRAAVALVPLALAVTLTGCGTGVGDGGPLVTRPPDQGTIAPGSPTAAPSDGPSAAPSAAPSDPAGSPVPSPAGSPAPSPAGPAPTATPSGATAVRIYLFAGEHLVPVLRSIDPTRAVGRAALMELLAGPTPAEIGGSPSFGTAVPEDTILLGLDVADGLATVDLSREFESGGGSASMYGRLAQVVFTLTQFPTVERVAFRLDGEPVSVFSGEGIVIDEPVGRVDFGSLLPPVFVDTPAWGAVLANPARLTGMANTFEASFMVEIRDANGRTLVKQHAMATCGTGCWGTFDVTVPYDVPTRQAGSVVTYVLSARDGSIEDLRAYPVTLVP